MHEQYHYDIWGERTERIALVHGESESYHYSAAGRLTAATATLANGTRVSTLAASYDAAGRIVAGAGVSVT